VPVPGDELLIIGRDEKHFVIGVLKAQGELDLRFPGDVRVHADKDLCLEAGEGITLSAPDVEVKTGRMHVVADVVTETARELYQRVRDSWSVRAGEKTEQVTGEWSTRAEKAAITTSEDVSVNGKEIRLG